MNALEAIELGKKLKATALANFEADMESGLISNLDKCGCCGAPLEDAEVYRYALGIVRGAVVCSNCGGIHNEFPMLPIPICFIGYFAQWHEGDDDPPMDDLIYVDLWRVRSDAARGYDRVHGWIHRCSRKWVQIG